MSEEILKALMQLFAIIAKQDEGVEENEIEYIQKFLTQQLNDEAAKEYMTLFYKKAGISEIPEERIKKDKPQLTSVKDSVRILGLCKKINKSLNQGQKVVVLVRLFELVNADRKFSEQRMAIINTVAEVFNITKEEFKSIESFVIQNEPNNLDNPSILVINDEETEYGACKHILSEELDGAIFILHVKSAELYFIKYTGSQDVILNGLAVNNKRIYLFANGSSLKMPKGKPVYYSDVVSRYMADTTSIRISFNAKNISYRFPNGNYGLKDINISETHGKLIGIMGASGAGKTTLLNVLSGSAEPTEGKVLINNIDLFKEKEKLEGVIGYIPQDDLLIEELTVFQNLYFSAKQCFKDKNDDEISTLVNDTLKSLDLFERKDLKVGSPLNKMISGGQRKRLNIALELIREPSILFVDEPTSGLSSRDSENVMDLLSVLSLKGKLIFVVIHQPSADIYKMFDRMVILDTGGFQIFYGNPIESIIYFKKIDAQINAEVGECPTCGNVTPELIFNIVEAKVVDEFGQYTDKRKVLPKQWAKTYNEQVIVEEHPDIEEKPPSNLNIPSWFNQFKIYTIRDIFSKISNKQYVALTLIEAPLLAFILAFIIRYIADPHSTDYIFYENENIPPYIFMSIVVALFLGLTVSAEEIFKDRKILKREQFLNLSRSSYLVSKVFIMFVISAIQSVLYVLIGNSILGVKGMWFEYWYVLFATSACANMMGLNISQTFNSAVTIYILIPLLMIPQMALGGAMFSFDKLNKALGDVDKVPFIAELMTSRWAYEGLIVNQYTENEFKKIFYEIEKRESNADYKISHYIPDLEDRNRQLRFMLINETIDPDPEAINIHFDLMKREFTKETNRLIDHSDYLRSRLNTENFNTEVAEEVRAYLNMVYYSGEEEEEFEDESIPDFIPGTEIIAEEQPDSIAQISDEDDSQAASIYNPMKQLNPLINEIAIAMKAEPDDEALLDIKKQLKELQVEFQAGIDTLKFKHKKRLQLLNKENYHIDAHDNISLFLEALKDYHTRIMNLFNNKRQRIINYMEEKRPGLYNQLRNDYHNEATQDYVRKVYETNKIVRLNDQLIQQYDLIYLDPTPYSYIDFRSHFYAPRKYFMGQHFYTLWFNVTIIWIFTLLFYITLYYRSLEKLLNLFDKFKFKKSS